MAEGPDDVHATTRDDVHATTRDDVHATTRDDVHATTRDDVHATTRDDVHATTRDDVHATTRESSGGHGDAAEIFTQLPQVLRDRYTLVAELPNPGAEADVVRVRDASGTQSVVKLYRRNITASREVWAKLRELSSPSVVRISETGTAAGRDYEVMEYLPGGNLSALRSDAGGVLPEATVREVVRQVSDGLRALHAVGIVHCDLKPENVLVRSTAPLQFVVTDFGLSRAPEQSVVAASLSGTFAYLAPEVWLRTGGQSSRARDWWALGMIVRELLTGERPFADMSPQAIEQALQRPIDLSQVKDARLALLCRGLLTRLREDRWGAEQVDAWLRGESPTVTDTAAPSGSVSTTEPKPFTFDGELYHDRASLAVAFARHWEDATRRYLAGLSRNSFPPPAWTTLHNWLTNFDEPAADQADSLERLVETKLLAELSPDVKMLHLLQWLNPNLPPLYVGLPLTADALSDLARRAQDPKAANQATARRAVSDLWQYALLPVLARGPGGEGLTAVADSWVAAVSQADRRSAALFASIPEQARPKDDRQALLVTMLRLVTDRPRTAPLLAEQRARALATLPGPVPWFQKVSATAGDGPVNDVIVLRLAPAAHEQAAAELRAAQAAAAAQAVRQATWFERETARLAGTDAAQARALRYATRIGAIMVIDLFAATLIHNNNNMTITDSYGTPVRVYDDSMVTGFTVLSLLVGAAVMALLLYTELRLAQDAAGQYVHYAAGRNTGTRLRSLGSEIDGPGRGCFVLLVVVPLIFTVLFIPPLFYGVVAARHLIGWLDRRRQWDEAYAAERTKTLGAV